MEDSRPHHTGERLRALDGLRGISALIVVIFHSGLALRSRHIADHGWLAIDVFFVLSGFVIALRYEDDLRRKGAIGAFLAARARRLMPTQILGTIAVSVIVFAIVASPHSQHALTSSVGLAAILGILLVPNNLFFQILGSRDAFPINPPLWSLFDEWIANIMYAAGLHRLRTAHALSVVAACWAYLLLIAWNSPLGWDTSNIYTGGIRAIAGFTAGVVVWRLHSGGRLESLPSVRPDLVYGVFFVLANIPMAKPLPVFEFLAGTWGAVTAVALLARSDRPVPGLFMWLGVMSYPLYTSHIAVVRLVQAWAPTSHGAFLIIPMVLAALLLALAVHHAVALATAAPWHAAGLNRPRPRARPFTDDTVQRGQCNRVITSRPRPADSR